MGKILTLRDTITIDIDNTKQPAEVKMGLSRDMPAPYVAMVMAQLIVRLMGDIITGISAASRPSGQPTGSSDGGQNAS